MPLESRLDRLNLPAPAEVEEHETVAGAIRHTFEIPEGKIVLTVWKDRIQEVIYQTPSRLPWRRRRRAKELLDYYAEGQAWQRGWPVDFGVSLDREDGQRRAIYAGLSDYMSFRTKRYDEASGEAFIESL